VKGAWAKSGGRGGSVGHKVGTSGGKQKNLIQSTNPIHMLSVHRDSVRGVKKKQKVVGPKKKKGKKGLFTQSPPV